MTSAAAELVVDARNGVGESPVWSTADEALYWVDIPGKSLHRCDGAGGDHRQWTLPEMPGCIAPRAGGGWACAMESGIFALDLEGDQARTTRLAGVDHAQPGMRFNDGRCDRQGRLRAGTMLMDMAAAARVGRLYGISRGNPAASVLLDDLIVPNGMAFSPDGRTMYLSDSHPSRQVVWAFDYDIETGVPARRRVFVDMKPLPGRPDGAAIDVDGGYWICGNDAGLVHRFTPRGELDRSLAVPVKKPAMCAFGGPRLDTLYVTSIRPPGDLADQPLAGGVFALRPGTQGLAEPAFQ
jgi:sugar lactone lactonase YvrE